ncbi:MAG TPA: Tat pathway signal protein, partial [Thermoanaerobaculia bacterium]
MTNRRRAAAAVAALFLFACAPVSAPPPVAPSAALPGLRGEALLDDVQKRTFLFFWETTNPENGLVPDRWPTPSFSSIAAVGF